MALAETALLAVRIDLEGNAAAGIANLQKNVKGLGGSLGRVGRGVGQVGAGLSRAGLFIGGAAITGLGAAAKAAIDFEDAFAGVRKTVDASESELAELAKQFRTMATEIPITADELARIGELGGALGIKTADLEEFTKTVALLGVTTDVATEDAATALGQLSNVLGLTADDFDNFGSALVDLGNKGASTESAILEVTRRAGAAAKLAGVAADETLGWSAAIANLGLQPELAGTALQNFFVKSLAIVSDGGKKLETFAEIAGMSAKDFKKAFDEDASGALETFIEGLGELPKDQRLKAVQGLFGKGSGLTRAILGLADSYDKNLAPSIDTAGEAWAANNALTAEAQKRFDTIRSKLQLLRNNLVEAGITLGEGFAPAIGRAAEKLSDFLKQDTNKSALKALGEDIGKTIDDIDWQEVLDGAKTFVTVLRGALDVTLAILKAVSKLPVEIQAAGAAFIGLNKLSGGLVGQGLGNIFGGLLQGVAGKTPGIGKLFAQPVFVTNWPIGGLGGGGGGGAAGAAGAAGAIGVGTVLAAASILAIGYAVGTEVVKGLGGPLTQAEQDGTGRVVGAIGDVKVTFGQHYGALSRAASAQEKIAPAITAMGVSFGRQQEGTRSATERVKQAQAETKRETTRGLGVLDASQKRTRDAALETKRETTRGAALVTTATRGVAPPIVSAIYANRPIITTVVNVSATTVTKQVTVKERYGPSGGSRDHDRSDE